MKLLSIAISSYNAAAYLHYCVESLVIGGEQVGILIINDGSQDQTQDQTQEIAECLASKYPNIVRAIYQENKGHGGVVNRGLAEASGRYFKVVDSDDWWILVPT
ncbi:Glycos_transf_2 domain protein [Streptococcus pneumoniae]|nr:Glycos_transf_2 domain protein [Streptococcus pneumoniae]CTN06039.1 Glycos_transf_2 domain protein [Streptococcus pneumoniae]